MLFSAPGGSSAGGLSFLFQGLGEISPLGHRQPREGGEGLDNFGWGHICLIGQGQLQPRAHVRA